MPIDKYYHFDDEFSFKGVDFIVEVYDEKHSWGYYDRRPTCKRRVGKIKPQKDIDDIDWPKGADTHFHNKVWYERPEKRHRLLLSVWAISWKKVDNEPEMTVKEQVEDLMEKLVEEWNHHANPDGFADVGLNKPNL